MTHVLVPRTPFKIIPSCRPSGRLFYLPSSRYFFGVYFFARRLAVRRPISMAARMSSLSSSVRSSPPMKARASALARSSRMDSRRRCTSRSSRLSRALAEAAGRPAGGGLAFRHSEQVVHGHAEKFSEVLEGFRCRDTLVVLELGNGGGGVFLVVPCIELGDQFFLREIGFLSEFTKTGHIDYLLH